MKRGCCGILVALSGWAAVPCAAQDPAAPQEPSMTLEQAVTLAKTNDPRLVAARLRRPIDLANLAVAGEWPNPEVRYEHTNELPHDLVSLTQPIELGGKRGRRIAVADAARLTGEAETAQLEAEAEADTVRAYYAVASAQRRAAIAREIAELAGRAHRVATEREEAGEVARLDVLQAGLALAGAQNEAAAQGGELAAARAELNTHVGRPVDAATEVAADLAEMPSLQTPEPGANAVLAVLDRQLKEAEARVALARAQQVPDLSVEGAVTHNAQPEFDWGYHAAVAMVVPIFTRHGAAVRLEKATLARLQAQRTAFATQASARAFAAHARAAAARTAYLRYRDTVLPQSREVEAMAEESYRAGQTGLAEFLESLRAARELRQKELQAASDYETALADLQRALRLGPQP